MAEEPDEVFAQVSSCKRTSAGSEIRLSKNLIRGLCCDDNICNRLAGSFEQGEANLPTGGRLKNFAQHVLYPESPFNVLTFLRFNLKAPLPAALKPSHPEI